MIWHTEQDTVHRHRTPTTKTIPTVPTAKCDSSGGTMPRFGPYSSDVGLLLKLESRHGRASLITQLIASNETITDQQLLQEQEQKQEQGQWQNHLWDHPHTFPLKKKWLLPQSSKPIFQNHTPKIYTTTSIRHTTNHHHKPLLNIINRDSRIFSPDQGYMSSRPCSNHNNQIPQTLVLHINIGFNVSIRINIHRPLSFKHRSDLQLQRKPLLPQHISPLWHQHL